MAVATPAQLELTAAGLTELQGLATVARRLPPLSRLWPTVIGGTALSRFRGSGIEYDESRYYQPGDDIRHL